MQQYRLARQSLRLNRMRTFLTTLGVVIGVASITLVLSLGQGAQQTIGRQVQALDNNIIVIKPGQPTTGFDLSAYNPYKTAVTSSLTEQDLNTVTLSEGVASTAPIMQLTGTVKHQDTDIRDTPIIATSTDFAAIMNLKIATGQFIDGHTARETVVLGQQMAIDTFGSDQVLGQQIAIKGSLHTIIGVLKNTGSPLNISGINLDHSIFISLDDGKSFNQGIAQIQRIVLRLKDTSSMNASQKLLDAAILANHQNERDFTVLAGSDISKDNDSLFRSIVLITTVVAAVTLVVGGVGIMNIMLVGVTERTREIGIRKALGATNHHILSQFLIEALIMCVAGGIVGLVSGYSIAYLIASGIAFQPAVTWQITLAGFLMALSVGILFGLYPAAKAARKDPIESLRQYQ